MSEIVDGGENCKGGERILLSIAEIDALSWQELEKLPDDDLSEFLRLTDEARSALTPEEWDAVIGRDDERLKRKYCGRLPDEIEEERNFDVSGEPEWFQGLWATDLSKLTGAELAWRRENKWDRGTLEQPTPLPDRADIDDDQDPEYFVTDEARSLWHRRIHAPTREEFEENWAWANDPGVIAWMNAPDRVSTKEYFVSGFSRPSAKPATYVTDTGEVKRCFPEAPPRPPTAGVPAWECIQITRVSDEYNWFFRVTSPLFPDWENTDAYALGRIAENVGLVAENFDYFQPQQPTDAVEQPVAKVAAEASTVEDTLSPNDRAFENLTHVPGLVGDVVNWITDSSRKPNRVLALGAAVTLIGTLIGRRVAGPTRTGTHLYVLGLAPTASGKQHPIDCAKELMAAVGAGGHIGPNEFSAMSAVSNTLERKPLVLCIQDEFGAFLKRVAGSKASGWEAGVSKIFREMWGLSFKRFDGIEMAGRSSEPIYSPALSIYGLSTPAEFYSALKSSNLTNGFVNRFLGLSTETFTPEREAPYLPVPDEMRQDLETLYYWRTGMLGICDLMSKDYKHAPDVRPWADARTREFWRGLVKWKEETIWKRPELDVFLGRTPEIAQRLATIRAAGRSVDQGKCNYDFVVDLSDIEWGAELAKLAGERLADEAGANMVDDLLSHGETVNKVIEIIKKARRIQHSGLLRKVQRTVKAEELKKIIATLVASETIRLTKGPLPPAGGERPVFYQLF